MIIDFFKTLIVGDDSVSTNNHLQQLASTTTDIFFVIIVLMFVLAVIFRIRSKYSDFTDYATTLLTSMGILGTFSGVVIGLVAFNAKEIDQSIGDLLAGLQTGFFTSVFGIFLSIAYKVIESFLAKPTNVTTSVDELSERDLLIQQTLHLASIAKAINDEHSDTSLVNLLKLYRSDASDQRKQQLMQLTAIEKQLTMSQNHEQQIVAWLTAYSKEQRDFQTQLWQHFTEFSDMLSKSATEQVITALKQVITDFNNNLTEQFGENFKELNRAVHALVQWQETYRQQLEQMIAQYTQGVQAITQTETSVANISNESAKIPLVMNELKSVLDVNQHQLNGLSEHLQAFASVRDRAIESVPEIHNRINQGINGMVDASDKLSSAIVKTADEFEEGANRVNSSLQSTSDHLGQSSESIKDMLSDAMTQLNTDLRDVLMVIQQQQETLVKANQDSTKQLFDNYQSTQQQLQDFAQHTIGVTENAVKQQVKQIDVALEQEM